MGHLLRTVQEDAFHGFQVKEDCVSRSKMGQPARLGFGAQPPRRHVKQLSELSQG
jgi:hypothetical protein